MRDEFKAKPKSSLTVALFHPSSFIPHPSNHAITIKSVVSWFAASSAFLKASSISVRSSDESASSASPKELLISCCCLTSSDLPYSAIARRAEQNLHHLQTLIKPLGWEVEVIDVLAQPERAEQAGILATPTLSYEHPGRPRRIVGDLSDAKKVLDFLGIELKRDSA